ncbi:PIN domain-containing protein [Sulfurimonas sp.]|jgi:predicted nucleic acid-binding protein|uniref:PIN domain-containing protein n=1 Tax=Sulfurimonas sp. TaxID=2022749 RepID=UPI002A367D2A|nr:PIN domain-containing protein [Sulfurimonas sp.]MDY0122950.1 PIN domain-containing protein [Sulfurimonas sp.]
MRDKYFLDTNILIYAFSEDEPQKQEIALSIIDNVPGDTLISNQVINEICNVFLKKFKLSSNEIENVILELDSVLDIVNFDISTQIKALKLKEKYQFQYFDALIVATALENKCKILYSEDMQHELIVENRLQIINPLKK